MIWAQEALLAELTYLQKVWIYGGTSEIMKTIIARDLTGLSRCGSRAVRF